MILKMPSFAELGLSWGNLWEGPFISFYGLSLDSNMCGMEKSSRQTQLQREGTTLSDLPQLAPLKTRFCSSFATSRFFVQRQISFISLQMKDIVSLFDFY